MRPTHPVGSTPPPFPAGAYYIGDLCYVVTQQAWQTLPCLPARGASLWGQLGDAPWWMGRTAYGDGLYSGQDGSSYGVDSGTIGVLPEASCHPARLAETVAGGYGHVVTIPTAFVPTNDAGLFTIGQVVIDTRGMEEDV